MFISQFQESQNLIINNLKFIISVTVSDKSITWSGRGYDSKLMMYAGTLLEGSKYTGVCKSGAWLNKLSSLVIVTTNHNIDTGQKTITDSSTGMNDKSWINLFKNSGLKNASSYNMPHVYFETTQSSRQTSPVLNKR